MPLGGEVFGNSENGDIRGSCSALELLVEAASSISESDDDCKISNRSRDFADAVQGLLYDRFAAYCFATVDRSRRCERALRDLNAIDRR